MTSAEQQARRGFIYGLLAYGLWGVIPLYFKLLVGKVAPLEIVTGRVIWSLFFLLLVVTVSRGWGAVRRTLSHRLTRWALLGSAMMIFANWMAYIYAVEQGQVVQASLGYFITPLVNVALGMIFLRERLQRFQAIGIGLATVGVILLTLAGGEVPWIALTLAISFGVYGLLRKLAKTDGASGLLIETAMLLLPSLGVFGYMRSQADALEWSNATRALLALSGIVTAIPLLCFGAAAHRLSLTSLGVLQYLAPTMQFLIAVLYFGEPFTTERFISFAFIWVAVAVYTYGSITHLKRKMAPLEIDPVPEEILETV